MAITLDGTDGITTTGLTSLGIDDNATSTAITIDASQNVGIGTASPASLLSVTGGTGEHLVDIQGAGATFDLQLNCGDSGTVNSSMYSLALYYDVNKNSAIDFYRGTGGTDGFLTFSAGNAERMRLDSTGGLRVGKNTNIFNQASSEKLSVKNADVGCAANFEATNVTGGYPVIYVYSSDPTSGSQNAITFYRTSGIVGGIGTTTTSTSYNTSSDYRLKENVVTLDNATDRLKQIPVHRFNFIADPDATVDGFLAHEVQDVVPEAISGTKDEVDDEGNPVYQGIDQSKLVPLLTAALQEAVATIEELKARVSALEAN